jgi:hypothetical protein
MRQRRPSFNVASVQFPAAAPTQLQLAPAERRSAALPGTRDPGGVGVEGRATNSILPPPPLISVFLAGLYLEKKAALGETSPGHHESNNFQTKASSTLRSSRAVPHPSTNRALRRLTSEFGRDPVHSTRYGRWQPMGGTTAQCLRALWLSTLRRHAQQTASRTTGRNRKCTNGGLRHGLWERHQPVRNGARVSEVECRRSNSLPRPPTPRFLRTACTPVSAHGPQLQAWRS